MPEVTYGDFQLPVGSKYFGSTGVDQVQFALPGHTSTLPRLAIFKRRQANGKPTSEYHVTLVRGVLGPDNIVRNVLTEFHQRNVLGQVDADVMSDVQTLGSFLSDVDFANDAVTELLLPSPGSIATS